MLLHKGFVYGLSRQSMFGVDKGGKHYQVTTIYVSSSNNGGKFTKTVWYELDENGLRHKLEKGFTHEEFHEKF